MSGVEERNKKKKVCKRRRKDWRKHSDVQDVDDFLNEQRQVERIGGPASAKKDVELFIIDEQTTHDVQEALSKKVRARSRPLTCYKNLVPMTAVPDPITKRNRVRSKEERESVIVKNFREKRRLEGFKSKKVLQSKKDRAQTLKLKKSQPKGGVFKVDLWDQKEEKPDLEWLSKDTLEHNLNKLKLVKVCTPKGVFKRKSVLPPLEMPLPGISYNPSYEDHQDLLKNVVEKELILQKKEAHLNRVTSNLFQKVTPEEKEAQWVQAMSQGLVKGEVDLDVEIKEEKVSDNEDTKESERLSINPPTDRLKAKTRKQRRIQKKLREDALQRKKTKVEKKKISDIYRLGQLHSAVEKMREKQKLAAERRKKLGERNIARTKRLGPQEFSEPDVDFSRPCELKSSLNLIKKQGNLLADRYFSLQRRNMLPPGTKNIGPKKAKVKKFVKASHKIDAELPYQRTEQKNSIRKKF